MRWPARSACNAMPRSTHTNRNGAKGAACDLGESIALMAESCLVEARVGQTYVSRGGNPLSGYGRRSLSSRRNARCCLTCSCHSSKSPMLRARKAWIAFLRYWTSCREGQGSMQRRTVVQGQHVENASGSPQSILPRPCTDESRSSALPNVSAHQRRPMRPHSL